MTSNLETNQRTILMRSKPIFLFACLAYFAVQPKLPAAEFAVEQHPDRLIITHDSKPVAH